MITNKDIILHYRQLVALGFTVSQGGDVLDEDDFVQAYHMGQTVDLSRTRDNGEVVTYPASEIRP